MLSKPRHTRIRRYRLDKNLPTIYFCRLCENDVTEDELAPNFESWRKQGKQKVIVGTCINCESIHG